MTGRSSSKGSSSATKRRAEDQRDLREVRHARKRVLLIALALTAVGGLLLAGVGVYVVRRVVRNPQRYERTALQLLQQGRFDDAMHQFRRALSYTGDARDRARLLVDMASAVEGTSAPLSDAAKRWLVAAELRVSAARVLPEKADALPIAEWYRYARLSHHPDLWTLCLRAARARTRQGAGLSSDSFIEAVATIKLALLRGRKPEGGWQAAGEALGPAEGRRAHNVLGVRALCQVQQAAEVEGSDPDQARTLRERAEVAARRILESEDADILSSAMALRVLYAIYKEDAWRVLNSDGTLGRVQQLLVGPVPPAVSDRHAEEAFLVLYLAHSFTPPPPQRRGRALDWLRQIHERARALVDAGPDAIFARMALAETARAMQALDEAERHYNWLARDDVGQVAIAAPILELVRRSVLPELAVLALDRVDQAAPGEREPSLAEARARAADLTSTLGDETAVSRVLQDWLAFYDGRALECLRGILRDRTALPARFRNRNHYTIAKALADVGESGGEVEMLLRIHRSRGRGLSLPLYWEAETSLVDALLRIRRARQAEEVVDTWNAADMSLAEHPERWLAALRVRVRAADNREAIRRAMDTVASSLDRLPPGVREDAVVLLVAAHDGLGEPENGDALLADTWRSVSRPGRLGSALLRRRARGPQGEKFQALAVELAGILPEGPIRAELGGLAAEDLCTPRRLDLLVAAVRGPDSAIPEWIRYLGKQERWQDFQAELDAALGGTDAPGTLAYRILESVSAAEDAEALSLLADRLADTAGLAWLGELARARSELLGDQPDKALARLNPLAEEWGFLSAVTGTKGMAELKMARYEDARESLRMAAFARPNAVAVHLKLAECAHRLSRPSEALESLTTAWRWSEDAAVMERFLRYAGRYGDQQAVIGIRQQIAERVPANVPNRVRLAELLYETERIEEARALIKRLEDEQVESLRFALLQARILLSRGERQAAVERVHGECLRRMAQNGVPDDAVLPALSFLRRIGEINVALELVEDTMDRVPPPRRSAWTHTWALLHYEAGNYERALEIIQDEADDEDDADLAALRVRCLMKSGRLAEAEHLLTQISRSDTSRELDLAEAELALAKRQWSRARRICGLLLHKDPELIQARIVRIQAALAGELEDAAALLDEDMRAVARLRPNHPMLYRVTMLQALNDGNLVTARNVATRLTELNAADPRLLAALGDAYVNDAQYDALREALPAWREAFPENSDLLLLEATECAERGDSEGRIRALEKAFEHNPVPELARRYALALLENDRARSASELLEDLPFRIGPHPALLMLRSWAWAGQGDQAKGLADWLAALKLRATEPEVLAGMYNDARAWLDETQMQQELTAQIQKEGASATLSYILHQARLQNPTASAAAAAETFARSLPAGHPLKPATQRAAADGWLRLGQPERALPTYKTLLDRGMRSAHVLNNAAYAAAQLGKDLPQAIDWARQAVEAADDGVQKANYLDTLATAQWKGGLPYAAQQSFALSIREKDNAAVRLHLAQLLAEQGRFYEAEPHLARAEQMAANDDDEKVRQGARALRGKYPPLAREDQ